MPLKTLGNSERTVNVQQKKALGGSAGPPEQLCHPGRLFRHFARLVEKDGIVSALLTEMFVYGNPFSIYIEYSTLFFPEERVRQKLSFGGEWPLFVEEAEAEAGGDAPEANC